MPKIKLVVFDMAGTTVDDRVNGIPLVLRSYDEAFRAFSVKVPMDILNEQRGRDKWTVIKELGGLKAEDIYEHFLDKLKANTGKVREVEGTRDTFMFLKERDVRVVTSTGFPVDVAEPIIDHLGWCREGLIDAWVCSEQVGTSRPDPAMICYAMKKHDISEPRSVVKVDDTVKGIEEGLNAGVYTVGVLTGTQSIQRLGSANPDTILRSIRELPDHLREKNLV